MTPLLARHSAVVLLLGSGLSLAAAPSLHCYFQTTLTDTAYQQKAFDRVYAHWKPARKKPAVGKKTVVRAVIGTDGKLVSTTVHLASGSPAWDDAALAAMQKSAPYAALPPSFKFPNVEMDCHFALEK